MGSAPTGDPIFDLCFVATVHGSPCRRDCFGRSLLAALRLSLSIIDFTSRFEAGHQHARFTAFKRLVHVSASWSPGIGGLLSASSLDGEQRPAMVD